MRLAPGAVAAGIAFGYDVKSVPTGSPAELRICLQGLPHKTVTLSVPPGSTVAPATLGTGTTGDDVLRVQLTGSGAGGASSLEVKDAAGHVTSHVAGPVVVVTGDSWHLAEK